jgi:hypothetical protein
MKGSRIIDLGGYYGIQTVEGSLLRPSEVLSVQQDLANVGATLDFIISPSMQVEEARERQDATGSQCPLGLMPANARRPAPFCVCPGMGCRLCTAHYAKTRPASLWWIRFGRDDPTPVKTRI